MQITAKLDRSESSTPWGFRMQGGKDFSRPLAIQRVTPGSLADKCGLQAGDRIVQISGHDVRDVPHKDAQQAVVGSGNYVELVLQRGNGNSAALPSNVYPMYETSSPTSPFAPSAPGSYSTTNTTGVTSQMSNISLNRQARPYSPYSDDPSTAYGGGSPQTRRSDTFGQDNRQPQAVWSEPTFKAAVTAPTNQGVSWSSMPSGNVAKPAGKWPPGGSTAGGGGGRGEQPRTTQQKSVRGRKGDAVVTQPVGSGVRIPICYQCGTPIRGPFVLALGKSWCPDHFKCANCDSKLIDIGFIEENGKLYCEKDYEMYFAPHCSKCKKAIVGDCVHAINMQYHPHCFVCTHCRQPIGDGGFHMEDGHPYCEKDWAALYQTKCSSCEFPIEPGDLWLEALGNHFHSGCFNCSYCQVSLEGESYFAKKGRPYCSRHSDSRY